MADLSDSKLKAFDTVQNWTNLIVTLSTGTIVFTATFRQNFIPKGQSLTASPMLWLAWLLLAIAILLGIIVIGALTAQLNNDTEPVNKDVFVGPIRWTALAQVAFFFTGIVLFGIFVFLNLS